MTPTRSALAVAGLLTVSQVWIIILLSRDLLFLLNATIRLAWPRLVSYAPMAVAIPSVLAYVLGTHLLAHAGRRPRTMRVAAAVVGGAAVAGVALCLALNLARGAHLASLGGAFIVAMVGVTVAALAAVSILAWEASLWLAGRYTMWRGKT